MAFSIWSVLELSWSRLGAVLGRLGGVLGRLGASWSRLGAVLERLGGPKTSQDHPKRSPRDLQMTSLSLETRFVSTFKKMDPENIKHYKNPEKLKWNCQNKSTAGEGLIVPA